MSDNIEDPLSSIIDKLDLKLTDPLSDDIKEYLSDKYHHNQCNLGRPELDYYCMLAYKDENDKLLCGAILNWSKHLQVEGLRKCFLLMKYEHKLAEANRRRKGNFAGPKHKKLNR